MSPRELRLTSHSQVSLKGELTDKLFERDQRRRSIARARALTHAHSRTHEDAIINKQRGCRREKDLLLRRLTAGSVLLKPCRVCQKHNKKHKNRSSSIWGRIGQKISRQVAIAAAIGWSCQPCMICKAQKVAKTHKIRRIFAQNTSLHATAAVKVACYLTVNEIRKDSERNPATAWGIICYFEDQRFLQNDAMKSNIEIRSNVLF